MSTALFLLRAAQLGLTMADLDGLTMGMVMDLFTEALNDQEDYCVLATQDDFDRF